ncbi:hypothetical protein LCGC14_2900280 [marine sediment metagenome]|uniref:Uncharacterized protein n=1 Tax=marine sediment metagenome TaxID=412755 RepID=A0A0F9AKR4_9ZZZZ
MKCNIQGSLSRTGYGIATLNIIKELYKQNVDVTVQSMGDIHINDEKEQQLLQQLINKQFYYDAPSIKIWHQFDLPTRP